MKLELVMPEALKIVLDKAKNLSIVNFLTYMKGLLQVLYSILHTIFPKFSHSLQRAGNVCWSTTLIFTYRSVSAG